uniref:Uncharacterized protein n=1 Tax=Trichogramma kaykai TaxID=54128 RepID=A0ABD2WQ92_9HYME
MFFDDSAVAVRGIQKMAQPVTGDDSNEYLKYPTVARNMNIIIRVICDTFESKCIKKISDIDHQKINKWRTTFIRDFIIILSRMVDISSNNLYLFALPKTPIHNVRYPSAYVLLHRYARLCGAKNPLTLRVTTLRKDLATKCIKLNLNDNELKDLAGFMGHHVNVHVSHNRKQLAGRDIPMFVKFLQAATGRFENQEKNISNNQDADSLLEDSMNETQDLVGNPGDDQNFGSHELEFKDQPKNTQLDYSAKKATKRSNDGDDSNPETSKKVRWSQESKQLICKTFSGYMKKMTNKAPTQQKIE